MTNGQLAVIIAALGASFLTVCGSLGVVWLQESRRGKAADKDALSATVGQILSRSQEVAMRAQTMGQTMKVRSGLIEGLDIAMHHRKPVDPLELHDWMAQDLAPLSAALSQIWTRWDQEGVRLANDVVGKCMDLLGASTANQPARTGMDRVRRWAVGERWTAEMLADNDRAVKDLALSRKRFAEYARGHLGSGPADLFAQVANAEPAQEDSPQP